jgi:hypothetical protein
MTTYTAPLVEFHEGKRILAALHVLQDADLALIAHGDGTVTCLKDRNGVEYKRRSRNQIPDGHLFAVEDAEAAQ